MSRPLELILARQWMGLLASPVLLFDEAGALVYFNEAAEVLLGRTYDESGVMSRPQWIASLRMESATTGLDIAGPDTPLARAIDSGEPAQRSVVLRGLDGVRRHITVTVVPVRGVSPGTTGFMAFLNPSS